jgi:hypothetical protein
VNVPGLGKKPAGFSIPWKILLAGLVLTTGLCLAGGCADKRSATGGEPEPIASSKPADEPAQSLQTQTLDFANPGDQILTNTVVLGAQASSGLPVAFGGMGPCRIEGGSNLTFTGIGMVTVVAVQPGNKEWMQAPLVKQSFMVRDAAEKKR